MNIKYMRWAFQSSLKITAAYFVISFIAWLWLVDRDDMWGYVPTILTWIFYFTIHVKDPKTKRKYHLYIIKAKLDRQN